MEDRDVRSYRDLLVWREGMDLAQMCYGLTRSFPREEAYGMTSQIRRASVSIPANIAEGRGRENSGEFVQFLRIAQGSLKELETHLILAARVDLATREEAAPILKRCETVGKMLRSLIRSIQKRQATKNPPTPYSQSGAKRRASLLPNDPSPSMTQRKDPR